jgi:hypothetical protein
MHRLDAKRQVSEHGRAMAIAEALLQVGAPLQGLRDAQRKAGLDQGHLGRKVIALEYLDTSLNIAKADIIGAAVITGAV